MGRRLYVYSLVSIHWSMNTPPKPARERILDAANRLFYGEGIRAVSVDAIAEKAGTTKKTLYYHFKSKDDLVAAYLSSRDQPNLKLYAKWFNETEGSLADKVEAIFYECRGLRPAPELERLRVPENRGGTRQHARPPGHESRRHPQEEVRSLARARIREQPA